MKKYNLIVVDPPWPVRKLTHRARPHQAIMPYQTMNLGQVRALGIEKIAADDAMLFLWTPQKFLFDARRILEVWGFNFLLTMVWEKTYGRSAGMPLFGFRWNAEFILVGYRTKPPLWPKRRLIPAVFQAPNHKHSQKPDRFYEMIAPLGDKRIDLFARTKRKGWTAWGNEVEGNKHLDKII